RRGPVRHRGAGDRAGAHAHAPRGSRPRPARPRHRAVDRRAPPRAGAACGDARARDPGRPRALRPERGVGGGPGGVPHPGPQHALRGLPAPRPRAGDAARGTVHARRPGRAARAPGLPRGGDAMRRRPAMLALEDGRAFEGEGFGAAAETTGEVVFNTAMTGYQEVLSDPSYCGQILTFTYPLIGNYGVNGEDMESSGLRAQGMVCRDMCEVPSNWRATGTLDALLVEKNLPGLSGVDTRALTRHLREAGTMRGCLSTLSTNRDELVDKARRSPRMEGLALADVVTCVEPYWWGAGGPAASEPVADRELPLVVVYDFGVKY